MDGIPCGCECEKLPVDPNNVYGGTYDAFTLDGDVFGVTLTVDGSSEVTAKITGMLDDPVECTVAIPDAGDAFDIRKAFVSASTVSIQGESVRLVRHATRVPLRFDSCAGEVGGEILLTASSECSTGGSYVEATPLVFTGLPWPYSQSSHFESLYLKSPPDGTYGHNACSFTIYRDGEEIASFDSPSEEDCTLSSPEMVDGNLVLLLGAPGLSVALATDATISSGDGSIGDPISVAGKNAEDFWAVRVTARTSGMIVAEWDASSTKDVYTASRNGAWEIPNSRTLRYDDAILSRKQTLTKLYLLPDRMDHPFPREVVEACSAEGSYLVVARHLTAPSSYRDVTWLRRDPTPLISYASFVIIKTKYAYAMRLDDDYWSDEDPNGNASDVMDAANADIGKYDCYFENPYVQRIRCGVNGPTSEDNVAKNDPLHEGVATATAHAPPPDGRRGATPEFFKLRDGGDRGLIYDAPLTKFLLRFSRPVTGITASMISVFGYTPPDGSSESLSVISLRRAGNSLTDYVVTIAAQGQVPNSMWTITFTPAHNIGTFPPALPVYRAYNSLASFPAWESGDREYYRNFFYVDRSTGKKYTWDGAAYKEARTPVRTTSFPSLSAFPAIGDQGVVYIDASTGADYVWTEMSYRRPAAEDCEEWGTTKLACRFMWCLGRDKSIGRYCINTKPDADTTIPVRASVSKQVKTPEARPAGPMNLTVHTTIAEVIAPSSSLRTTISDAGSTGYIPQMPPDRTTQVAGVFSYFGIPTTIYPAKPKWVGECQSPSHTQRHASMFFGAGDIERLAVTTPVDGVTVNVLSEGMPQNFWAGAKTGGVPDKEKVQTYLYNNGYQMGAYKTKTVTSSQKIVVAASRGRLTYRELQTTSVTELVLKIFIVIKAKVYRSENTYNSPNAWFDKNPAPPPDDFDYGGWQAEPISISPPEGSLAGPFTIIVPPDKEAELGELEDTDGRRWTIEKVED